MSGEAAIVFWILGVAAVLFVSGRVRLDVTALLVVLALILTGTLTPREALAASAAFVTPVVTLIVTPGNYRFLDFVKVGLPLLILCWLTTLLVTPIFFPF